MMRIARRALSTATIYEGYGSNLFKGAVAEKYLKAQGLSAAALDDYTWTSKHADKVAAAVSEWAAERGASSYCHWFQPLGASGVRHGLTGQVQNMMIKFGDDGQPVWDFKGKDMLKGETDGSSYDAALPAGGKRCGLVWREQARAAARRGRAPCRAGRAERAGVGLRLRRRPRAARRAGPRSVPLPAHPAVHAAEPPSRPRASRRRLTRLPPSPPPQLPERRPARHAHGGRLPDD